MGLLHSGADLIFPSLLQSLVMHEKSRGCFDPTFSIKAKACSCDDQMDMGMPLHYSIIPIVSEAN
jgi:hypothetical protein